MPADEYGQFVAVQPIDIGSARAFATGDAVPASTVDAHPEWLKPEDGSDPLVARTSSKAAKAAVEPA